MKGASKPFGSGPDLRRDDSDELTDVTPHRQLIGSLLPLSNAVQPEISFAVGYLSRLKQKPISAKWIAAKTVLHYLKGTKKMRFLFERIGQLTFEAFADVV